MSFFKIVPTYWLIANNEPTRYAEQAYIQDSLFEKYHIDQELRIITIQFVAFDYTTHF